MAPISNGLNQRISIHHHIAPKSSNLQRESSSDQSTTSSSSTDSKTDAIVFPSKSNAIILTEIIGISLKDYVTNLSHKIDPKKIHFISRIPTNKICIYLESKEDVQHLIGTYKNLAINGYHIPIDSLMKQSIKLIIWTVPIIPHNTILKELKKLGLKPVVGSITFQSAGIFGYEHISSFKRQVLIDSMYDKIPDNIEISYKNELYMMYLTFDEHKIKKLCDADVLSINASKKCLKLQK